MFQKGGVLSGIASMSELTMSELTMSELTMSDLRNPTGNQDACIRVALAVMTSSNDELQ